MKSTKKSFLMSLISLILCFLMLTGTTWAWFTDVVTSENNVIQAGTLDISLEHTEVKTDDPNSPEWLDASAGAIFTYENWEPGFAMVKYVKIENEGSLDLKFMLNILPELAAIAGEVNLADVIEVYMAEGAVDLTRDMLDPESDLFVGNLSSIMGQSGGAASGNLDSGEYEIYTLALKMSEDAGNEYQELTVGGSFTLKLIATQRTSESDSFGPDYDEGAQWPELPEESTATSPITLNADGTLAAPVTFANDEGTISITLPAGTKFKQGTANANLNVNKLAQSGANITLEENEETRSFDVHVKDLADDNSAVISIAIKEFLPVGLNMGNYKLYHVEDTATIEMTLLADGETPVHNSFNYDPATGDVVLHLASFSEIALVAEPAKWEGGVDHSWYVGKSSPYTIANADQLWSLSQIVGGMAEGIEQDSFKDKTIKLVCDIDLDDDEEHNKEGKIFYPIGYYNSEGTYERTNTAITSGLRNFEGTFDGNGNTISNFYQNTWEMKGDHNWYTPEEQYYRDGMGLFGRVYKGTVKNLTVKNFSSDGEIATTGVIAAYADGATFENIAIFNCNPRVYNIGNGGIVGCVGWYAKEADLKTTFKNITVDNSNKISALWGSYDVACGGIVGQYYPTSGQTSAGTPKNGGIDFVNCHVAAQMDVYNDVCANYQYYAYRYTGMLIGSVRENETIDGHSYPKMDGITASGCTVHFGTWNDYYYCEFEKNGHPSYSGPDDYKFSRIPHSEINFTDSNGNGIIDTEDERASVTGCKHEHTATENNQAVYLPFNNLVTGYGWGVTTKVVGELAGVTILDREVADSKVKFDKADNVKETYMNGKPITIGDIFKAAEHNDNKLAIRNPSVTVTVSPADENSTVTGEFVANTTDWTKGTITFKGTGKAKITITDYYFCTPTTITVNVTEREAEEKFDVVMNNGDFLHRVGNVGTVALDKLFKAKDGVTVGTVSVTVEAVNGTSASGTYSDNAIKFNGTGVVKVTITDNDYCTPTELYLEVVDATNVVSATDAKDKDIVLLNNIGSGFTVDNGHTVYGNGFTLTYTGDGRYLNNGLKQGVVMVQNGGTLDNLHIKAPIYPTAFMYYGTTQMGDYVQQSSNPREVEGDKTRYYYQLSAVATYGEATISNCYIYGGRTNIYVNTGNVTIKDTILECGVVSNVQIQSTSDYTVTLENLTTIQYRVNATIGDTSKVMLGTGILVGPETTSNPTIVLNGNLKQYNWVTAEDADAVSSSVAKTIINGALDATEYNHTVDGKTASNLGIIFMNEENISITNNTGLPYKNGIVSIASEKGQVYSLQGATEGKIYSDYENADRSTVNGDYIPRFDFDLGDQEISYDGNEDTRYLYGDKNGVTALYQDGNDALTLDLTKLATIYKYNGINYVVTAVCKDANENTLTATNGVVTLDAQGSYTLIFTVEDNIFYNAKGETITKSVERTFTVPLTLTVKEANVKNALVNITKTALDGVYNTVNFNDYELRINFLDCISVTDYDKKGSGTTVSLSSNIASVSLTPASVNVFTTAFTVTITYSDGRVLTVNFSNISGSSPGTKTGKVNTSGSVYFTTEGALNNKPTEASSQNKCTITSVSYKGNSGSTVTNDTDVTVTWALESSGGSSSCVTPDTLITLADGTQVRVDSLTGSEELLVWNMETGKFDKAPIMFLDSDAEAEYEVIKLRFSDGTEVKVIYEHGFWDYDLNRYVYLDRNAEQYIGHTFAKQNGNELEKVQLVDVVIEKEMTTAWSPVTVGHLCYFVNGMLSMPGGVGGLFNIFEVDPENMTYDYEQMEKDIETYGLFTYEELNAICPLSEDMFNAAGGAYLKISIGKGNLTMDELVYMITRYSVFFE